MNRFEPRPWNPSRQYEPSSWRSRPVVGLALIIGSTLGIVGVSFFGPSAVTLSLGPRYGSLLPPWYIPSTWNIALGDWTAVMATYVCIALGAMFHVDGMYQGGSRLPYLGPSDSVTAEGPKNETPTMPRVEPMMSARPTTGRLRHELGSYWRDGFHGRGSKRFMARPT